MALSKFNTQVAEALIPILCSIEPQVTGLRSPPEYPERVFAHWYSGVLRIPQGELLEYVHAGYGSIYEKDLLIDVENGVVINTSTRVNSNSTTQDKKR